MGDVPLSLSLDEKTFVGEKVERYLQLGEIETTQRERCRDLHQRNSGRRRFSMGRKKSSFFFSAKAQELFLRRVLLCVCFKKYLGEKILDERTT